MDENLFGDFDADMEEGDLLQFNLGSIPGESFADMSARQASVPPTPNAHSESGSDDLESLWRELDINGGRGLAAGASGKVPMTDGSPTLASLALAAASSSPNHPEAGGGDQEAPQPTNFVFGQEQALGYCVEFIRARLVERKVPNPELWVSNEESNLQALAEFGAYVGNRHLILQSVTRRGAMNGKKVIITRNPTGRAAAAAPPPRPTKRIKSEGAAAGGKKGNKKTGASLSPPESMTEHIIATLNGTVSPKRRTPSLAAAAVTDPVPAVPGWWRELLRIFAGQEQNMAIGNAGFLGNLDLCEFHSFLEARTLPVANLRHVWWHRVLRLLHNDAPYASLKTGQPHAHLAGEAGLMCLPLVGEVQCQLLTLGGAPATSKYFLRMCPGDPWARLVGSADGQAGYIGASLAMVGILMSALLVNWWQAYSSDPAVARAYAELEGANPRKRLSTHFEQTAAKMGYPDTKIGEDVDTPYLLMVPDSLESARASLARTHPNMAARANDYLFVTELCYRILLHVECTAHFHQAYP